jgi:hypothetical protein
LTFTGYVTIVSSTQVTFEEAEMAVHIGGITIGTIELVGATAFRQAVTGCRWTVLADCDGNQFCLVAA